MRQSVARRSASKQAAQARRLNADRKPAKYVLDATVRLDSLAGRDVVLCKAHQNLQIGSLQITAGETYYLLSSIIGVNRFYAARQSTDGFKCSSKDSAVAVMCSNRIRQFRQALFSGKQEVA